MQLVEVTNIGDLSLTRTDQKYRLVVWKIKANEGEA